MAQDTVALERTLHVSSRQGRGDFEGENRRNGGWCLKAKAREEYFGQLTWWTKARVGFLLLRERQKKPVTKERQREKDRAPERERRQIAVWHDCDYKQSGRTLRLSATAAGQTASDSRRNRPTSRVHANTNTHAHRGSLAEAKHNTRAQSHDGVRQLGVTVWGEGRGVMKDVPQNADKSFHSEYSCALSTAEHGKKHLLQIVCFFPQGHTQMHEVEELYTTGSFSQPMPCSADIKLNHTAAYSHWKLNLVAL